MSTRRSFLSLSAAAFTAVVAFPKTLFAQQPQTQLFTNQSLGAYAQGMLNEATFNAHLGQVFTASHADDSISYLTLRKVASLSSASAATSSTTTVTRKIAAPRLTSASQSLSSFYATFEVSGAPVVQESLLFDNGTMGSFAAFVVPGTSTSGAATCAATFTTLVGASTLSTQQLLLPTITRIQR